MKPGTVTIPNVISEEKRAKLLASLKQTQELVASGWAGCNRAGTIVDRRIDPTAIPLKENPLLKIPKPQK